LCREKGWRFPPFEPPPWWPDLDLYPDPSPAEAAMNAAIPMAKQLRARLIAEIVSEG
jgi:hypothetical protein